MASSEAASSNLTPGPSSSPEEERLKAALGSIERLCAFGGDADAFWTACLATLAEAVGASDASLVCRRGKSLEWKSIAVWPTADHVDTLSARFQIAAQSNAETCAKMGAFQGRIRNQVDPSKDDVYLAVRMATGSPDTLYVASALLRGAASRETGESLRRLKLLAHLPFLYEARQQVIVAEHTVSQLGSALDLMAQLNRQRHFLAAAMTLCNELSTRLQCNRVSLGWLAGQYVRLKAMSHAERFDKRAETIQWAEAAMEEALDQDETIVWPETPEQMLVIRDHARYAGRDDTKYLCSVPMRIEGKPVAALLFERNEKPFLEADTRLLELSAEVAVRLLADLKSAERWFGARWAAAVREWSAKIIGAEHTGLKLIALGCTIALGFSIFGSMDFRVDAPFLLQTKDVAFLAAPFDGFLSEVKTEVGDEVQQGDTLGSLDTRDILLEEAGAAADQLRYQREAEKTRAANKLADMQIAEAQAEQARVKLDLARFHRGEASLTSPFNGAVVEGDLKKRIGAPVKQGEVLFKISRVDHLYVECSVSEKDVHELGEGGRGEIALASQPGKIFPVRIERIEPAAKQKDNANVFVVRCIPDGDQPEWWRPGMSGVAKLQAGRRSPGWIFSHRTIDFLRMRLWW